MRNLKRALSLALASVMVLGLMVVGSSAKGYDDVTSEENVEAIEVLQAVGIMTGDENGNFNPTQNVTRNEMAVIMSNLMDYRVATYKGTSPFTDVPEWAEPYVAACYTNGIIAGYNATTFGGSDPVVTSQATLMVLKALGYFQYQSDFGDDWQLTTINQANKVDLLVDVDSAVRVPMTRNDVAQLVLNGLEAGTVEVDTSNKMDIMIGDTQITNGTKYDFVTSTEKYAFAINSTRSTTNQTDAQASVVQLGEKLYQGDLTKTEDVDDFGRPANIWVFETKEVGKYAEPADYVWSAKVTAKTLYDTIGRTATGSDYTWTVTVDGEPVDGVNGQSVYDNRNDNDKCFLRWNGSVNKISIDTDSGEEYRTGNGAVTQVFVDSAKSEKTVHVAVMHRYVAEVLRVDSEDGTITLSDKSQWDKATSKDEYETTEYEEGDIVIYTYARDKIQEVYAAEMMEGQVTRVRINTSDTFGDNFVADGETYSYNHTMKKADKLVTENVNNNMVGYLDEYGYVAYIDQDAVTYEYAYVLSIGTDGDNYGSSTTISGDTYYARLVLTDGTMLKTQVDVQKHTEPGKTTARATCDYWQGQIVSYSKDSKGVYTLAEKMDGSNTTAKVDNANTLKIETNKASFVGPHATYTINSKTVFIVATPDGNSLDDYNFSVYTGIANVPDIDGKATGTLLAVTTGNRNGTIAKVVYIEDADTSGENVIFIRTDSEAKLVKDSEVGNYYELNAWIEGEATTLRVKEGTSAAAALVKVYPATEGLLVTSKRTIVAAKNVTLNTDELVTSVRLYEPVSASAKNDSGFILGIGTEETRNEAITLNSTGYGWSDTTLEATQYNNKNASNAFERLRVSSIKDDGNDQWLVVLDENMVTGYCLWYRSGEEGVKPSGSSQPNQPKPPVTDSTKFATTTVGNITVNLPAVWGATDINAAVINNRIRVDFKAANVDTLDTLSGNYTITSEGFRVESTGASLPTTATNGVFSFTSAMGNTYSRDDSYVVTIGTADADGNVSDNLVDKWAVKLNSGWASNKTTGTTTSLDATGSGTLKLQVAADQLTAYNDKVSIEFTVEGLDMTNAADNVAADADITFNRTTGKGTAVVAPSTLSASGKVLLNNVKPDGKGAVTLTIDSITDASTQTTITYTLSEASKAYATMPDYGKGVGEGLTTDSAGATNLAITFKANVTKADVTYTVSGATNTSTKSITTGDSTSFTPDAVNIPETKIGTPVTVYVNVTPTQYTISNLASAGDTTGTRATSLTFKANGEIEAQDIVTSGLTPTDQYNVTINGETVQYTVAAGGKITAVAGDFTLSTAQLTSSEDLVVRIVKKARTFTVTLGGDPLDDATQDENYRVPAKPSTAVGTGFKYEVSGGDEGYVEYGDEIPAAKIVGNVTLTAGYVTINTTVPNTWSVGSDTTAYAMVGSSIVITVVAEKSHSLSSGDSSAATVTDSDGGSITSSITAKDVSDSSKVTLTITATGTDSLAKNLSVDVTTIDD